MKRASARSAVATPTPAMLAPQRRFQDLRSAHIVDLPTPHRRNWYRILAVGCAAAAAGMATIAVSEHPLSGVVAVIFALATYGYIAAARKVTAQLRRPPTASFDEPTDWQEAGADAMESVSKIVVDGGAGLLDAGLGYAAELSTGFRRRRKPKQAARWHAATAGDLLPGERRLVSCRAQLVPHGARRLLMWLSLGLAAPWMYKGGWLTTTEQRLLFHRRARFGRHRGRYYVQLSARLPALEVLEWFQGQYAEARQQVLVIRCANGRSLRFNIDRVWAEEAQLMFELIASCSTRLPAFLAARWTRAPTT